MRSVRSSGLTDLPAFPKAVRLYLRFADFDISVRTDYRFHRRVAVKKHVCFFDGVPLRERAIVMHRRICRPEKCKYNTRNRRLYTCALRLAWNILWVCTLRWDRLCIKVPPPNRGKWDNSQPHFFLFLSYTLISALILLKYRNVCSSVLRHGANQRTLRFDPNREEGLRIESFRMWGRGSLQWNKWPK